MYFGYYHFTSIQVKQHSKYWGHFVTKMDTFNNILSLKFHKNYKEQTISITIKTFFYNFILLKAYEKILYVVKNSKSEKQVVELVENLYLPSHKTHSA